MNPSQTTSLPLIVKLQVALAVLATLVTIGLVLYLPSLVQKKAQLDSEIEQLHAQKKELRDQVAELQKQTADLERQKADAARLGSALASALYATNPVQAQKTLEESVSSNAQTAALPRIFIHLRSDSQRAAAEKIAGTLRQNGYHVPAIQILVKTGPDETQVRYFHATEAEASEAQKLLTLLAASGVKKVAKKPNFVSGHPEIRPRQYEIWFAPDSLWLRLAALEKDATAKGFLLIARKAAAAQK